MSKRETQRIPAADWWRFFKAAGVREEELEMCKSAQARAIKIGQFLAPKVGRAVPVQVRGRAGRAVLRVEGGRSREKCYFFEVTWDEPQQATTENSVEGKETKKGHDEPEPSRKKESKQSCNTTTSDRKTEAPHRQGQLQDKGNNEDWG
jgi:hypothetical protein